MNNEKQTVYDVDYFISKFSAIPEDKWIIGALKNQKGSCCALGHCGAFYSFVEIEVEPSNEARALRRLFDVIQLHPSHVNDDCYDAYDSGQRPPQAALYDQPTPKARILAALEDIKRSGLV